MNKFFCFLMVGFAFTGLQVATVAAEDCASKGTPDEVAKCWDQQNSHAGAPGSAADGHHPPTAAGDHDGMKGEHHPPTAAGDHDGPDCASLPTPGEVAACWDAKAKHDGMKGEHHDGPPIDPRGGHFTKADEAKFQKYADECEATQGVISQGSKDELIAMGFTALMVDELCKNGPQHEPAQP